MDKLTFTQAGIADDLVAALAEFGITEPSPVQAETIPPLLEGRDVVAASQTGTGKTLAYLLPLLQNIDPLRREVQKLILAPTQELSMQIVREAERYGAARGIRVLGLIGGAAIKRQVEKLREHPHLVVGTPGRIRELIGMRKLKMHEVNAIVIDEADQMFKLGGTGEVEKIVASALKSRQLVMLSATLGQETRALAERAMKDPAYIGIDPERTTARGLEHYFVVTEERDKMDMLRRVIRHYNPVRALVFVNATEDIAEVEAKLNYIGLPAAALYGDADKVTRSHVLNRFREGKFKVLVASDVAARGLDIEKLTLVVSYDPAFDSEHYVHRAGRTGRMNTRGMSVTLVTPQQTFIMRKFSRELGIELAERVLAEGKVLGAEENKTPRRGKAAPEGRKPQSGAAGAAGRGKAPHASARPEGGKPGPANLSSGREREERSGSRTPAADGRSNSGAANGTGGRGSRPGAQGGTTGGKARISSAQRERDRKNKGAPRWLKNKGPGGDER